MTGHGPDEDVAAGIVKRNLDLVPFPYGEGAAAEGSGTTATPLFAGFALTVATLVIQNSTAFRWPDVALLLLVTATLSLVVSVQAAQWTRAYRVTPREVVAWWPDAGQHTSQLEDEIRGHHDIYVRWRERQAATYHLGLIMLLSAFAVALVPPGELTTTRMIVVILAALGVVFELVWLLLARRANGSVEHKTGGTRPWAARFAKRLLEPRNRARTPPERTSR